MPWAVVITRKIIRKGQTRLVCLVATRGRTIRENRRKKRRGIRKNVEYWPSCFTRERGFPAARLVGDCGALLEGEGVLRRSASACASSSGSCEYSSSWLKA